MGRGRGASTRQATQATARGTLPDLAPAERWEDEAHAAGEALNSAPVRRQLARLSTPLIIDMDDTLISNQVLFDHAKDALLHVYAQLDSEGRDREQLSRLHSERDAALVPSLGYTPHRWFTSAASVGEEIAGRPLTEEEAERVREAANIAMGIGEILPGVSNTLRALSGSKVEMVLKTKGCRDKQQEKLAGHGFREFFGDRIHIVDRKDAATFREIPYQYGFGPVVSIGDSEKSDIAPALEAGHEGILIDRGAPRWEFEVVESDLSSVTTVRSFPMAIWHLLRERA